MRDGREGESAGGFRAGRASDGLEQDSPAIVTAEGIRRWNHSGRLALLLMGTAGDGWRP